MIKYILQSEKEHLFEVQKLISAPTKVHSTAVPLRRQLWVATSHLLYQGGNPTSISNNNISIQRTNLRATFCHAIEICQEDPIVWTQQPKQLPSQALLFVLLVAPSPPPCSPQSLPRPCSFGICLPVRVAVASSSQKSLSIICSDTKTLKGKCFTPGNKGNNNQLHNLSPFS